MVQNESFHNFRFQTPDVGGYTKKLYFLLLYYFFIFLKARREWIRAACGQILVQGGLWGVHFREKWGVFGGDLTPSLSSFKRN